jgi:mannosyltransferase OCH1-like enzyme
MTRRMFFVLVLLSVITFSLVVAKLWYGTSSTFYKQLQQQAQANHIDFDVSMQTKTYASLLQTQRGFLQELNFFKDLYNRHNFKQVSVQKTCKIPQIIHHIWLGGALRENDEHLYTSWRTCNPEWTFIFWTDDPKNNNKGDRVIYSFDELEHVLSSSHEPLRIVVNTSNLSFENKIYFDQSPNYGEKSDILRYEIVYRFGGVYVDCDFECYKELTLLHHMYDFYTGLQPLDTNRVQLGCALFGAIPKHPIMKNCVENIKHNRHIPQIIAKTGPLFFTREFYKTAGRAGLKDIAFPASYFYPCGYEERYKAKSLWCKVESFANHHWAGSWLEPSGFVKNHPTKTIAARLN